MKFPNNTFRNNLNEMPLKKKKILSCYVIHFEPIHTKALFASAKIYILALILKSERNKSVRSGNNVAVQQQASRWQDFYALYGEHVFDVKKRRCGVRGKKSLKHVRVGSSVTSVANEFASKMTTRQPFVFV